MLGWRQFSGVGNFTPFDRPNLAAEQSRHGYGFAVQRGELDFEAFPMIMHEDNAANITFGQPFVGQVSGQDNIIKFPDHGFCV